MTSISTAARSPAPRKARASVAPPLRRSAQFALRATCRSARRAAEAFALWRLRREMLGVDAAMLKDIGIPPCGLDWALRNGRENRPMPKAGG